MSKNGKIIFISFLSLVVLLFVLYALGISLGRWYVMRDMTPAEKAMYEEYREKRWAFDEKELYPEPFTSGTLYAVSAVDYYYTTYTETFREVMQHIRQYRNPSNMYVEKLATPHELAQKMQPLFPAMDWWREMAVQPDFDMQALVAANWDGFPWHFGPPVLYHSMTFEYGSLFWFQAERAIDRGKSDIVLQDAEALLMGTRVSRYCYVPTITTAVGLRSRLYPVWSRAVTQTDDVDVLKQFLEWQDQYAYPDDLRTSGTRQLVNEYAGGVRLIARFGHHIDIQNMTAEELFALYHTLGTDYMEYAYLPELSGADRRQVEGLIQARRARETRFGNTVMIPSFIRRNVVLYKLFEPVFSPFLYKTMVYHFDDTPHFIIASQSEAMLLKVETAARIYELESGKRPGTLNDLKPLLSGYVPEEVLGGKGDVSMRDGRFYHFGVDGKDDGMKVLYDALNGTMSSGDIFFSHESPFEAKGE